MSDWDDEDEAEEGRARKRPLSNLAMLGFLWRQWMRDPPALGGSFVLTLVAVAGLVGRSRPPASDGIPYVRE